MHEVAIVRGIVSTALEAAERNQAERISRVSVVLGDLTHVTEESLRFHFEILSQGTAAEHAEVVVRTEQGLVTCRDCGEQNPATSEPVCPACGSVRIERVGGDQCYVESIDIDEPDKV
jgi:hydrogenase nickel incorporation protein HypA/HybF